eukprot:gene4910-6121_t
MNNPMIGIIPLALSHIVSRSLYAVAFYGIADQVESKPESAFTIAKEKGIDGDVCYRMMRLLSGMGVFHEEQEPFGVFSKTPLSTALTNSDKGIAREYVLSFSSNEFYLSFDNFLNTVKNGKTDKNIYKTMSENQQLLNSFATSMNHLSAPVIDGIVNTIDFSNFSKIVDLGGSDGFKFNNIKEGINFELPEVIERNKSSIRSHLNPEILNRFKEVGGSFFDSVPDSDCFTLKHVLHNFSDENVIKILKVIKKSLNENGKVYIFNHIVSSKNEADLSKLADINWLQLNNGKERSKEQWYEIANESGFKIDQFKTDIRPGLIILSRIVFYQIYITRPTNSNTNITSGGSTGSNSQPNYNNNNNNNNVINKSTQQNIEKLVSLQNDLKHQQNEIQRQLEFIEKLVSTTLENTNTISTNAGKPTKKVPKPRPTLYPGENVTLSNELAQRREQFTSKLPNTCFPLSNKTICLPNFIIIGTMKSGTTFLDYYLQKHPQIAKHSKKEIWFFNSFYSSGIEWYANHFEPIMNFNTEQGQKVIGEATPFYINSPYTAARMYSTLRNVKIIITLRDPVDRCLSQYHFSKKWLERNRGAPLNFTFDELIHEEADVIDTCLRGHEEYQRKKDERQVKINLGEMTEEEDEKNPLIDPFYVYHGDKNWRFYKECHQCINCFPTRNILHVSGHPTFGMLLKSLYFEQIDHWLNFYPLEQILVIRYEDQKNHPEKVFREIEEFIGLPPADYGEFQPKNVVPHDPMNEDTKKFLVNYFREPNQKLYKLLNRDFEWLK